MSKSPDVGGIAAEQLQSLIMRIERLEEDKANVSADIRDVYAEAKGQGFDVKIMRAVIRLRKLTANDYREQEEIKIMRAVIRLRKLTANGYREQEEILDLYKRALGMEV